MGATDGHRLGTSGLSPSVSPFNAAWRDAVAITTICSGAFFAIAIAWFMVRKMHSIEAGLYLGTAVLLVTGAVVWGARLGDFNTFHLFFGGIAVFATPVAAVAVWSVWMRLRATGHRRLAIALLVLCVAQVELGIGIGIVRLMDFGPGAYPVVPEEIVATIKGLPTDARLAYACQPSDEVAFWTARLLGIDAHTGRRIVPMCFEADTFGLMNGTPISADVPSPLFQWAPQRRLYPDSDARPSPEDIALFMKANDIDYIYVDAVHPNTLVPDAIPVATRAKRGCFASHDARVAAPISHPTVWSGGVGPPASLHGDAGRDPGSPAPRQARHSESAIRRDRCFGIGGRSVSA